MAKRKIVETDDVILNLRDRLEDLAGDVSEGDTHDTNEFLRLVKEISGAELEALDDDDFVVINDPKKFLKNIATEVEGKVEGGDEEEEDDGDEDEDEEGDEE